MWCLNLRAFFLNYFTVLLLYLCTYTFKLYGLMEINIPKKTTSFNDDPRRSVHVDQ